MRYFKLTDAVNATIEYIKVNDINAKIAPKSEDIIIEEISESTYLAEINQSTSNLDLFMPTI